MYPQIYYLHEMNNQKSKLYKIREKNGNDINGICHIHRLHGKKWQDLYMNNNNKKISK